MYGLSTNQFKLYQYLINKHTTTPYKIDRGTALKAGIYYDAIFLKDKGLCSIIDKPENVLVSIYGIKV